MDINAMIEKKVEEILENKNYSFDKESIKAIVKEELSNQGGFDPSKYATVESITEFRNNLNKTINTIASDLQGRVENSAAIIDKKIKDLEELGPTPNSQGDSQVPPERIIIERHDKESGGKQEVTLNAQHQEFRNLLNFLSDGIPLYIHGPTGSGKTTATYNAAKALGLQCYRKVMSRETGQHELFGYMDAQGKYVEGVAYRPYRDGGVLLCDEVDNGNPNTNTALKMLNDGAECYFPCGIIPKHTDFKIVANANTIGNGANSQYVGRNQQDKAFLNIFAFLQWDYDESFEAEISWAEYLSQGGDSNNKRVFDKVVKSFRDYRSVITELQINHILSPRNLLQASRMLAKKRDLEHIKECVIWRGLDSGAREKIEQKIKAMNAKGGRPKIDSIWATEGAV